MAEFFALQTHKDRESIDITKNVRDIVRASGVRRGLCHVMVLHATAAVVVNENADPNIGVDVINGLERSFPDGSGWLHDQIDDNAGAHIKASVLGPSEIVPIEDGDLLLGTWQALMLLEFDGPRKERRVAVQILRDGS